MKELNDKLEQLGWIFESPNSRWASAALPVAIPGSSAATSEFRQACDYRSLNALTEALTGVVPILRIITEHVRGMEHFGLFDFIKPFWQLPLAKACQEMMSYMTDDKIYTPTRVPQGCSDAALHFQRMFSGASV